jgi:hypothetical protein
MGSILFRPAVNFRYDILHCMKDAEPESMQEKEFSFLRDQIVAQLKNSCSPQYNGQAIDIVKSETNGGTVGLYLDSDGNWSGCVQMMGWPMGPNPTIESLLDQYAWAVGDKVHDSLLTDDNKRMNYVLKNREQFFSGLIRAMKLTLGNTQDPAQT